MKLKPRPDWSPLGVQFKFSDEHPSYGSPPPPPPGRGWTIFLHFINALLQLQFFSIHGIYYKLKARYLVQSLDLHPDSNLFFISVLLYYILCNSGDAQFVSATYRLFKVPQDSKTEASRVTYKGISYNLNERGKKWQIKGRRERMRYFIVTLLTDLPSFPPPPGLPFDLPIFPSLCCSLTNLLSNINLTAEANCCCNLCIN